MASITRLQPVYLQPQPQQGMSMQMTQSLSSTTTTPTAHTDEQPRLGLRGGGMVSDCVEAICCFEMCKGLCDCCC